VADIAGEETLPQQRFLKHADGSVESLRQPANLIIRVSGRKGRRIKQKLLAVMHLVSQPFDRGDDSPDHHDAEY
jgi:hypothetical protein